MVIQIVPVSKKAINKGCVINMFAQDGYGYNGKRYTSYDAFWNCLNEIKMKVPDGETIAFPYKIGSVRGGHWEGCTKADDALRSQFADDGFICLLVTRESVRLVNDYEWTCGTQCVKRPVVSFDSHIIVIACEHLAGSEQGFQSCRPDCKGGGCAWCVRLSRNTSCGFQGG